MFAQFKLLEINGDDFVFSYNGVADDNNGKFTINSKTNKITNVELAKCDDTGCDLRFLLRKSLFYNKLKEYIETRTIDNKHWKIHCG